MAITPLHQYHIQKPQAARKFHGSMFYSTGVNADRSTLQK